MRQFILVSLFSISTFSLFATHNRAGEIVYKQIGPKTVEATIVTYSKTSSFSADRDSIEICWGDNICSFLSRTNAGGEELDNDYKVNYYTGSHVYGSIGRYTISMTDPNRNSNVLNIGNSNSDLVQFHIESTLFVTGFSELNNHSPELLEPPVDIGFIRQPFMHTPNAIDKDGDSIAYELITPLSALSETVPNFRMVDEIGASPENTFTFNETTGLFVWTNPQMVGEYNIAYKIKSYRNGLLQDEIIRDMQILILPEENTAPIINTEVTELSVIEIKVGSTLDLVFSAYDPEDSSIDLNPSYTATSEVFDNGARQELVTAMNINKVIFQWTPNDEAIRTLPYQLVFKAVDSKGLATFKVILIKVKPLNVSTTRTFKELDYQLFPNPTTDVFNITLPTSIQNEIVRLSIFDSTGKLVAIRNYEGKGRSIQGTLKNLAKGNYTLLLTSSDGLIVSSILIKI